MKHTMHLRFPALQLPALLLFLGLTANLFGQIGYDNTFATNGRFFYNEEGTGEHGVTVLEQPDGKIILVGYTDFDPDEGGNYRIVVIRLNANGTYDNSFGTSGKAYIDTPNSTDFPYTATLQQDGKILIAGWWKNLEAVLYRLNGNGSPDDSFGTNGVANIGGYILNFNVRVQPDGKIVTSGVGLLNGYAAYLIARFMPDGNQLDNTFNNGTGLNRFRTSTSNSEEDTEAGRGLAIQADGKIVSCGNDEKNNGTIVRLNPNGTLDATWGSGGVRKVDFTRKMYLESVAVQDDGKIVVGGTYDFSSSLLKAQVMRFLSNGNFDNTFNGSGLAWYGSNSGFGLGDKMILQCDGKILIGGGSYLFRVQPNGALDPTFGNNGYFEVTAGQSASSNDILLGVSTIYLTGNCRTTASASDFQMFVARLNNDINCGTTSTNDLNPTLAVSVFPNPVRDLLTIRADSDDDPIRQVAIVDMTGRILWSNDHIFPGESSISCDMQAFSPGTYYVVITTALGRRALPLVKL